MRTPKPATERKKGTTEPELLREAVLEVIEKQVPKATASRKYQIPRGTLRDYVKRISKNGLEVRSLPLSFFSPRYATRRIFTDEQERALVKYLQIICHMHYGLSPLELRQLCYKYATSKQLKIPDSWTCGEKNQAAGEDWYRGFMQRHPELTIRQAEATSLGRATAFNRFTVQQFFNNLRTLYDRHCFSPENIWNVDETGLSTVHKPGTVIAEKGQRQVGKVTSGERGQNITLCICVSAIGNTVPPMMIFPRKTCPDILLKGAPPGTIGFGNEKASGWMTTELFVIWLNHFISHVKPTKSKPVLLILDNHITRYSSDLLELAKENGVNLLTVPPHTTHKLQPLDRSVMFPIKAYYNREAAAFMSRNKCKTIAIANVAEILGSSYFKAVTQESIISGFRCTGIHPFNPEIFQDHEYLSSSVSDRPEVPPLAPFSSEGNSARYSEAPCASEPPLRDSSPEQLPVTMSGSVNDSYSEIIDLFPLPKGSPRKQKRRTANRKKTEILTDTPVKERIQQEVEKKNKKQKVLEMKKLSKTVAKQYKFPKRKLFREAVEYESSSEDFVVDSDCCSDESLNVGDVEAETEISGEITVGDFILTGIDGKRSGKTYYVASVLEINGDDLDVKFLKKVEPNKFVYTDEQAFVERQSVEIKLDQPVSCGGTKRQSEKLTFGVDLSAYKIK